MADIFPFHAFTYNQSKIQDISSVVSQPYDKIDDDLRESYYAMSPYHIVRLIKRKGAGDAIYREVADDIARWVEEGILQKSSEPVIFVYHQEFDDGAVRKIRKGFSALMKLEEFGKRKVYPHEETHSGPKVDRLKLLHATGIHFGQIFLLYHDKAIKVNTLLDAEIQRSPDMEVTDPDGVRHRVWKVHNPSVISQVQKHVRNESVIIADGHHRYETALNFMKSKLELGEKPEGNESFDKVMATFVNMDDEGLVIYPTHRLLFDISATALRGMIARIREHFTVREYAFNGADDEPYVRMDFLEDLRFDGVQNICFGLALKGEKKYYLISPKEKMNRTEILDVSILHSHVLERCLGVTLQMIEAEQYVDFERHADEAIDKVFSDGKFQSVFLLNPVRMNQLQRLVVKGKRLPQKATDFYPKLLTGFMFAKVHEPQ